MPEGEGVDVRIENAKVTDLCDQMISAAGDRNLWVVGGGNVASQFADAGLLDEVLVTVVPVVLGAGKPLFDNRLPGGPMELLGTRVFDTGMVELRYRVRRYSGATPQRRPGSGGEQGRRAARIARVGDPTALRSR